LYLRAAEAFCMSAGIKADVSWRNEQLLHYLTVHPGHGASLARFVSYCRLQLRWPVNVPSKALWKRKPQTSDQIRKLRDALNTAAIDPIASLPTKTVARILALTLDLPAAQLVRARAEGRVGRHPNGHIEIAPEAVIPPENSIYPYAERWLALAERAASIGNKG
jgi:hypothetical protein